jgi:patatin-like phospholipase/acyl hydrolase
MKKILSLDGGGIRGVITLRYLIEIEHRTGKKIGELFDLICGTSTGGIIALALSLPDPKNPRKPLYSAAQVLELYKQEGPNIFPRSGWHKLQLLNYLKDEKYNSSGIEGSLLKIFGEHKISQSATDVMLTSYDIELRRPFFFKFFHHVQSAGLVDAKMWEAARASSAAPTYFEPYKLALPNDNQWGKDYLALIDGGVFANNPAMCAYTEAVKKYESKNIMMVSVGSGDYRKPYHYDVMKDLRVFLWARPIVDIMMYGGVEATHYQMRQILQEGHTYFRFQTQLSSRRPEKVDDASGRHISFLEETADKATVNERYILDTLAQRLIETPWSLF